MRRQFDLFYREIHLCHPLFHPRQRRRVIPDQQSIGTLIYREATFGTQQFIPRFRQFSGISVMQGNMPILQPVPEEPA